MDVALAISTAGEHSPIPMKAAIVFLILASLGLGVGLMMRHKQAVEVKKQDDEKITVLSKNVEDTKNKLDEQEKLAMYLQTNLVVRTEELSGASNNLAKLNAELVRTQKEMQAAAEAARADIERRDAQISKLTTETNAMTQKLDDMNASIGKLGKLISDTERKLAASEGDREFLLKELKRLQVEKADLERQFNDLSVLRTQVAKLKEELSIARRLEWIRLGIYGASEKKGAEKLMAGTTGPAKTNNFNLNVELKQDGGAQIVTPDATKPPATAPPK
jgi:septal ring factor EnvC (AmiA/AmiB activator)